VFRGDDLRDVESAEDLLARVARKLLGRRIHIGAVLARVHDKERYRRVVADRL
jgi:hypothetical protein